MSRAYNFSPGPATLPESVLRQAQADLVEWGDARASIVEVSHRGPEFLQVARPAEADLRTRLAMPAGYAGLLPAGGATAQQALFALNGGAPGQRVDYVISGRWGKTAVRQLVSVDVNIAA